MFGSKKKNVTAYGIVGLGASEKPSPVSWQAPAQSCSSWTGMRNGSAKCAS